MVHSHYKLLWFEKNKKIKTALYHLFYDMFYVWSLQKISIFTKLLFIILLLQECSTAEEYKELLALMEERLRVMRQVANIFKRIANLIQADWSTLIGLG